MPFGTILAMVAGLVVATIGGGGKKKQRRAKKSKGGKKDDAPQGAGTIKCSLCRLTFASGNALHKHLKDAHSGSHKKKR